MYKLSETVEIATQPEKVFSLLCDSEKRMRLNPVYEIGGFIKLNDAAGAGARFQVQFKDGKESFTRTCEVAEFSPNEKLVIKAAGGEEWLETFVLEKIPAGTRMKYTLENLSAEEPPEKEMKKIRQDVQLWLISLKQYSEMHGVTGRIFKSFIDRIWLPMSPPQRRMALMIVVINAGMILLFLLAVLFAIILSYYGVEV